MTLPVRRPTPATPDQEFAPEELARARAYHRSLRRVAVARSTLLAAGLVALVVTRAAPRLLDGLGVDGWVARLVLVVVGLQLASLVIDLPADAWVELRHDRRWGLSTATGRGSWPTRARPS